MYRKETPHPYCSLKKRLYRQNAGYMKINVIKNVNQCEQNFFFTLQIKISKSQKFKLSKYIK